MGKPPPPDPSPERPIRTCIGCRRRRSQDDLVRIVRTEFGKLRVGRTLTGRGAWLCRDDPTCFDEAARRGGFARALRARTDPTAVEALRVALYQPGGHLHPNFVPGDRPARD